MMNSEETADFIGAQGDLFVVNKISSGSILLKEFCYYLIFFTRESEFNNINAMRMPEKRHINS